MIISFIACSVEYLHVLDRQTLVCLDCGQEAIEIEDEQIIKKIINGPADSSSAN